MESYADAMTLLLAFFIMMFAFALTDQEKFQDFKVGIVQALGVSDPLSADASGMLMAGDGIAEVPGMVAVDTERVRRLINADDGSAGAEVTPENAEALRQLLEDALHRLGAGEHTTVGIDERGVVIRFDDRVLFPSGSNQLVGEGAILLRHVGAVLGPIDNHVSVEGHTDSVPTRRTTWPTNWELSTARATTVLRHLLDVGGLPAPRLSATGYADTRPRASNRDEVGRRQNRRVEVVVVIEGLLEAGGVPPTIDPGINGRIELPTTNDERPANPR